MDTVENTSKIMPVAIVTGGAIRIGAATSQALHREGYDVIVHYRSSSDDAQGVVDALNSQRANSAIMLQADLNQASDVEMLAQKCLTWRGRIDVLVNNASTFYPKAFEDSTSEDWETLFNSNVKGAYFLSQYFLASLKTSQGCIINIIDANLERLLNPFSTYQMAKAALATMTKALAKELAPDVRVNGISPGSILWSVHEDESQAEIRLSKIPMQRLGVPEDIAHAAVFLTQANYVTGHILTVDGGKSL